MIIISSLGLLHPVQHILAFDGISIVKNLDTGFLNRPKVHILWIKLNSHQINAYILLELFVALHILIKSIFEEFPIVDL